MGTIRKLIKRKKTILYKDCEEVMLDRYFKIIKTKNLSLLVRSGSIPKVDILENKFEEINTEFASLRGKENMTTKFDLISYKEELILKCHFGAVLIDMLQTQVALQIIASQTFNNLISELKSWGFDLNEDEPLIDELIKIKNEIEALQTTIESLYNEIYPESENEEENEEKDNNQSFNLYEMLLIYQRILKIDKINPKKTSLLEFSVIEKQVKDLSKKQKSNPTE